MNEFIEALKTNMEYDYIASNYYKLDKEELKEIILNLLYLAEFDKNELILEIKDRCNI